MASSLEDGSGIQNRKDTEADPIIYRFVWGDENVDNQGWVFFDVDHTGGVHDLWMQYTSDSSRPVLVQTAGIPMYVPVAFSTRRPSTTPAEFWKEGTYDLFQAGRTRVGFQAVGEWPNITAFYVVPQQRHELVERTRKKLQQRSYFGFTREMSRGGSESESNDRTTNNSTPTNSNSWWKQSPTAVTLTFEIGMTDVGADFEYQSISLQGKTIKFTFGEAHDCLALDGDPIGDQYGGENFPQVARVDSNQVIQSMALGLSTYSGEAAFHSLSLCNQKSKPKQDEQRILVGALLKTPVYIYDRDKLGLNLWITTICAPRGRPVARYGFTLSSDDCIAFNAKEFDIFWQWLVTIKYQMASAANPKLKLTEDDIANKMSSLRQFLLTSFSGQVASNDSSTSTMMNEGWLYGTNYHVCLVFDVFSLLLYKMPGSDEVHTTFFVNGQQYDSSKFSRLEEVPLRRNDILAYAITSAARDTDLLYQMGLLRPSTRRRDGEVGTTVEREVEPLLQTGHLFPGDYTSTPMARRAMVILAMAGLRKAGFTILTDDIFGWDIYSLASQKRSGLSFHDYLKLNGASLVCMLIQILVPLLLSYRAVTDEDDTLTWDTYVARIIFLLYAGFKEMSTWGIDREERVVAWLCFFPDFSTKKLIWGRGINQISKVITTVATIGLIVNSYTGTQVAIRIILSTNSSQTLS